MTEDIHPVRWLKTPKGPAERRAHVFHEGGRVSLCGRQRIPVGVVFDEMIEVPRDPFGVERCNFCWLRWTYPENHSSPAAGPVEEVNKEPRHDDSD